MRRVCCGLLLCLLLTPTLAGAEFYRYRDAQGTIRFTDNIAEVPPDQRPGVRRYEGTPTAPAPGADAADGGDAQAIDFEDLQAARMQLNDTKAELDREFGELMRDKEALSQERAQVTSAEEAAAVKEKILELNRRITDYERRRQEYENTLAEFKAREQAAFNRP